MLNVLRKSGGGTTDQQNIEETSKGRDRTGNASIDDVLTEGHVRNGFDCRYPEDELNRTAFTSQFDEHTCYQTEYTLPLIARPAMMQTRQRRGRVNAAATEKCWEMAHQR